jgi:NhaP-type Na+/H+ or K+/H+ antiporter
LSESLFNDGIAVVLFQISSVYLLSYMEMGGRAGQWTSAVLVVSVLIGLLWDISSPNSSASMMTIH